MKGGKSPFHPIHRDASSSSRPYFPLEKFSEFADLRQQNISIPLISPAHDLPDHVDMATVECSSSSKQDGNRDIIDDHETTITHTSPPPVFNMTNNILPASDVNFSSFLSDAVAAPERNIATGAIVEKDNREESSSTPSGQSSHPYSRKRV